MREHQDHLQLGEQLLTQMFLELEAEETDDGNGLSDYGDDYDGDGEGGHDHVHGDNNANGGNEEADLESRIDPGLPRTESVYRITPAVLANAGVIANPDAVAFCHA
ncbi:MAG: hypothetical protein M1826_002396 [Phylliscum demangeonii]|nr:MAG: hypothetical protein M1826_002396 [Phylliscum demangeonii]